MESDKTRSRLCPLIARPRTARRQGTSGIAPIKPPMRGSRALGIARPKGMGPAMTLFEPVGKKPEPSAPAGFVPSRSEDDVARHLLRPLFDDRRETLLLAGFDAFDRQIGRAHSELQSLMRISYAVFCLKKKKNTTTVI